MKRRAVAFFLTAPTFMFWFSLSAGLSEGFSGEEILLDFPELAECGDRESRLNHSAAIGEHCICSEFVKSCATSPDLKNLINSAALRILVAHFAQTRFEEDSFFFARETKFDNQIDEPTFFYSCLFCNFENILS